MKIPFNKPFMTGNELGYITQSHLNGQLSGDGPFTKKCQIWLEEHIKLKRALLTHSCTAALEMAALLLDFKPGDEVILPSYTFVSSANAFALRGATPVFVDIRPDTLNLDEQLIAEAITSSTKAIVPVHYAGVACEMDSIIALAKANCISVVEDAAQSLLSTYKNKPLGSIGNFGAFSFHETKNVISGEGGLLSINDSSMIEGAEIIREKGTDRSKFFNGLVDKYTWQKIGSSYLPGELAAAFLWAQLQAAREITSNRLNIWDYYHKLLEPLEVEGILRRPIIPAGINHNAHMYYVLLESNIDRQGVINQLMAEGIQTVFHYIPLHDSPGGLKYGKFIGSMKTTNMVSKQILRLPLWIGLEKYQQEFIVEKLKVAIKENG